MREVIDMLKSSPEAKLEIEVNALVHTILESRERRNEILSRYAVTKPEDIKAKIAKSELNAHPAFEDYLSQEEPLHLGCLPAFIYLSEPNPHNPEALLS